MPLLRALYHSFFFPLSPSPSPSSAPTQPPSSSPLPKYPSTTTTTTTTTTLPFFPTYPSPPPPPPPSLPTFPANISSLTLPASSHSAPRQTNPSKLLLSIFIPILTLLLLLSLLFLLHYLRRRRRQTRTFDDAEDSRSDSHRLFPPNSAPSDINKLDTSSRPTSSEFLYLGTLVSSRPHPQVPPAAPLPVRSPELRPLPPLSRPTADAAESSSDEFYSPKAAPLEKKFGSNSSSSSSSPTVSSLPVSSSPSISTIESLTTKKAFGGDLEKNNNQQPKLLHSSSDGVQPERLPPPPPPPPPPLVPPRYDRCENDRRVKLKALHWDKLPPSSGRAMVWDQLKKSGSFQLNEEMIESLFVCNAAKIGPKGRREEFSSPGDVKMVLLDPKKSQNIAILLKALNVSKEDVCDALLEGNADSLGCELLETLQKMAPNKEEEHKLKEYRNDSNHKLGLAETFLKAVLDIPYAFKRVDAMLYIANFNSEVNHLKQSFQTLEEACDELRNSRLFLKLLEAVLKTGNRMNIGTNRGDARAFKLDTLVKLVDIKGTDGKTTLLHFVVQEIVKAEGYRLLASCRNQVNVSRDDQECKRLGLQVVSRLGDELINVKKAAAMDFDMLCSSSSKLATGIDKIRDVIRLNNGERFHESMNGFLRTAEGEIVTVQMQEGVALSMVRELTEYFHGDSAKEEAHPFRIFVVVRDFLSILDRVCKEANTKDDRAVFVSTAPCQSPVCHESSGSSDDSEAFSSSP